MREISYAKIGAIRLYYIHFGNQISPRPKRDETSRWFGGAIGEVRVHPPVVGR
jgi:hypothetical protein